MGAPLSPVQGDGSWVGQAAMAGQGQRDNNAILSKGRQYSSQIPVLPGWGGHGEAVDTSLLSHGQAFSLPVAHVKRHKDLGFPDLAFKLGGSIGANACVSN